jgi:uncharacterized heparinase superfamily protein
MIETQSWPSRGTRLMNRLHARLATRGKDAAVFAISPEPRTIGSVIRGRQLLAGEFLMAGHLVTAPGARPWDMPVPSPGFEQTLHGFGWLDDLAAVGDAPAREVAADWLWTWIERYGRGRGPGWTPALTGRRIIRWISHAHFLLRDRPEDWVRAFHRSLLQQARFLTRRWASEAPGLPRFEALTGLIHAGMALEGLEEETRPAIDALTRDPEELLEVFSLLTWAAAVLADGDTSVPQAQLDAIARIAPTLRTLRHADGGLARFHGGGRGAEGRLDHALAVSGVKTRRPDGLAMGFARLSAGRTSVIVDAAPPPSGSASYNAHASTLAFELTSGRRPMIVNCGSGASFGVDWRRAGRATPSHSTLCLEGYSSARLGPADRVAAREELVDGPAHVPIGISPAWDGHSFQGGHDGYVATHGLTHARTLELSLDGRGLAGEDMLLALDKDDRQRLDRVLERAGADGLDFDIRFHLHPEVFAEVDPDGKAVSLVLKSGEVWVFRAEGRMVALEPSVYLESSRLNPRVTRQIVLSDHVRDASTRLRWSLSKPQEAAIAVRDLVPDALPLPEDDVQGRAGTEPEFEDEDTE